MTDLPPNKDAPSPAVAAMKQALGRYRRRGNGDAVNGGLEEDDWKQVVDPSRAAEAPLVWQRRTASDDDDASYAYDCWYKGPLYELRAKPGVYVAPRALGVALQRRLAYAALTRYCEAPHATNIDGVPPKPHQVVNAPHENMWYLWKQEQQQTPPSVAAGRNESRKRPPPSPSYYRSFRKLSWTTVGYHYDWTRRLYHADAYSDVPAALQAIGTLFARTVGGVEKESRALPPAATSHQNSTSKAPRFTVSAAIINYYTCKSVMGGHRDDLEYDDRAPIVSLSLGGRPCLFLVGSVDEQDDASPVVPLLLRPGDVLILSGPHRMAYHAMARLLPVDDDEPVSASSQTLPPTSELGVVPPEDEAALDAYLRDHRININLRQVYPDGQDPRCPRMMPPAATHRGQHG
jgi:alkylated DNA repair protein alkB family protein 1